LAGRTDWAGWGFTCLLHAALLCASGPTLDFFRMCTTVPLSSKQISSIRVFIR
jgi:hypothetical protein